MTTAPMNGDEAPVTRRELREELSAFRTEMKDEFAAFKVDVTDQFVGFKKDILVILSEWKNDLSRELARHVTVAEEQTQRLIIGLDDRYRDLPGRVTVLERELDEHRRDAAMHPRRRRR